jgi:hypothetical protein
LPLDQVEELAAVAVPQGGMATNTVAPFRQWLNYP